MDRVLEVWGEIGAFWPVLISGLTVALTVITAAHAVLNKRDPRARAGWVGVIVFAPPAGAFLYFLFGINRIQRRASKRRSHRAVHIGRVQRAQLARDAGHHPPLHLEDASEAVTPSTRGHLNNLAHLVDEVGERPLEGGNTFRPLLDGDEAYPAMIAAIDAAETSVALCTYIFDNDKAGLRFQDALARAVKRGVEVRVLIDAVGARYTIPPITWGMRKHGIKVYRYGRTIVPWRFAYFNLRNHRKVLVVDGVHGFTGGINIRQGHVISESPSHPARDLHFSVEGPVVRHLMEAFALDWAYTSGETLEGESWFPQIANGSGQVFARGINDGPDEDFERLRWTILGALSVARRSVQVVTPYFLPDRELMSALSVAAMRGVRVDIILPSDNNLAIVDWASRAVWKQLLDKGCRLFLSPPPFDHSKLMVVDAEWVLLGSCNWDPRSLRLNFEFNVECYDKSFGEQMRDLVHTKRESAHRVSVPEMNARHLILRLRDGVAHLFSPYL